MVALAIFWAVKKGIVIPPVFSGMALPERVLNNKFLLVTENSIDESVSSVGLVKVLRMRSLGFAPSALASSTVWAKRISRINRSIILLAFVLMSRSVLACENAAVAASRVLTAKSEINARIAP